MKEDRARREFLKRTGTALVAGAFYALGHTTRQS